MSSDELFLEASASIARGIAAAAVWHGGRCSWMGAVPKPASSPAEYHALGPSLYGGTAGVGLFLAHLAAVTGEAAFRETSLGALRHATSRAPALPLARRAGFHTGTIGVAWAAAAAARLLEDEELHARAHAVLGETPPLPSAGPERCPDLVSGLAGSIVGLLALAGELDDHVLVEDALCAGDALLNQATITSHGSSWSIPGRRYPAHLCGIAHGVAGIGLALVELFAATGESRWRDAALEAFRYERSWLDAERGRWPDLRIGGQRRGGLAAIDSGITGTWCYGEAGIGLTRLRAVEVLGDGPHRHDVEVAIGTTRRYLVDSLPYAFHDLSLCHGLGGAADVLLSAGVEAAVIALGHVALERYAQPDAAWPCGVAGESTPGLFLGCSGIGWLFLRLHDRATPSPLVPKMSYPAVAIGSVASIGRAVPMSL
jgi:lantibiotic modifying enzyme